MTMSQTDAASLPRFLNGMTTAPGREAPASASSAAAGRQKFWLVTCYLLLVLGLFSLPLLGALGIASYFRLSSETRALRSSVMESVPGHWDKQVAVNVGGFTLGLARFVASFFNLPPEAKAAMQCLDGGDVGVYQLRGSSPAVNYSGMLASADQAMKRRGWERMVGVVEGRQLVAVYLPHDLPSTKRIECCVVVLDGPDLVVVSAHGNAEALLALMRTATKDQPLFGRLHALSER